MLHVFISLYISVKHNNIPSILCHSAPRYGYTVIKREYEVTNLLKYTRHMVAVFTFTEATLSNFVLIISIFRK
jgi:hypothetical protein